MNSKSLSDKAGVRSTLSAIGMTAALIATPALAAEKDKAAVLAANAGYYAALNIMFTGDVAPMLAIWSHEDDITFMGPNGKYYRGWIAVRKDWEGQAAMKLGGNVEPAEVNAVVGQDLAVVSNYEIGENTNADGKTAPVKIRGTNTFRKEAGVWKMIGHHTDTLPYLNK